MSAQTSYTQSTPRGAAGALVDLSEHAVNTRINAETGFAMMFGLGVVQGSAPGSDIKIPASGATAEKFEGITVNGYTNEMDREGAVSISPGAADFFFFSNASSPLRYTCTLHAPKTLFTRNRIFNPFSCFL